MFVSPPPFQKDFLLTLLKRTAGEYICMARDSTSTTASATATATSDSTSTSDSDATSTTGGSPGLAQTDIASDCNKWLMRSDKGKYCQDMADEAGISLDCFYKLNPAVNPKKGKCQGLLQGEAYCVGTESNVCV